MAFQTNTAANVTSFANRGGQSDNNRADAFINVYLPTKNGRRKVGYIPLKGNRAFEKAIIERLAEGGEEAMKSFMSVMQVEFHSAEAEEDNLPQF